jgi:hypothetical protein
MVNEVPIYTLLGILCIYVFGVVDGKYSGRFRRAVQVIQVWMTYVSCRANKNNVFQLKLLFLRKIIFGGHAWL